MSEKQKSTHCPACNSANSLVDVENVIGGENTYITQYFCCYCSYAEKNWRRRTCKLEPKLRYDLRKQAVEAFFDDRSTLLRDLGVCQSLVCYVYNKSLANQIGYSNLKKKQPTIHLPVYNTWNSCVGSLKITKTGYSWPKKNAMAMILGNSYCPEKLFIVDNPVLAMAISYTMADEFIPPSVSVMVIKPGQGPHLKLLQFPRRIYAFVRDEQTIQFLKKSLPVRKTMLFNTRLPISPGCLKQIIDNTIANGETIYEKLKRKQAKPKRKAG